MTKNLSFLLISILCLPLQSAVTTPPVSCRYSADLFLRPLTSQTRLLLDRLHHSVHTALWTYQCNDAGFLLHQHHLLPLAHHKEIVVLPSSIVKTNIKIAAHVVIEKMECLWNRKEQFSFRKVTSRTSITKLINNQLSLTLCTLRSVCQLSRLGRRVVCRLLDDLSPLVSHTSCWHGLQCLCVGSL